MPRSLDLQDSDTETANGHFFANAYSAHVQREEGDFEPSSGCPGWCVAKLFFSAHASRKECALHLCRSTPVWCVSQWAQVPWSLQCSGQNPTASWRCCFAFIQLAGGKMAHGWGNLPGCQRCSWISRLGECSCLSPSQAGTSLHPIWEYKIMLSFLLGLL